MNFDNQQVVAQVIETQIVSSNLN